MRYWRGARATAALVAALLSGSAITWAAGGAQVLDRAHADSAASHRPLAKLEPCRGAYLGIYYGDGTAASTDAAIGRSPRVHLTYFDWRQDWASSRAVADDLSANRIPLVNWEPFGVRFTDIVHGRYDGMITKRARQARALGHDFFLDFAAEMNEDEGWGDHDPARYIAAWRHIHDVFTREGATNAVWVWAPNNADSPGAPKAVAYYPGDAYVDWTGMDGYNWGTSVKGYGWDSFRQVFAPLYRDLARIGKPILIGETASDDRGGSKAAWIAHIVPTLRHRFPLIHAVVWFDIHKERHWRFRSSAGSLAAFRKLAADPYFR